MCTFANFAFAYICSLFYHSNIDFSTNIEDISIKIMLFAKVHFYERRNIRYGKGMDETGKGNSGMHISGLFSVSK